MTEQIVEAEPKIVWRNGQRCFIHKSKAAWKRYEQHIINTDPDPLKRKVARFLLDTLGKDNFSDEDAEKAVYNLFFGEEKK